MAGLGNLFGMFGGGQPQGGGLLGGQQPSGLAGLFTPETSPAWFSLAAGMFGGTPQSRAGGIEDFGKIVGDVAVQRKKLNQFADLKPQLFGTEQTQYTPGQLTAAPMQPSQVSGGANGLQVSPPQIGNVGSTPPTSKQVMSGGALTGGLTQQQIQVLSALYNVAPEQVMSAGLTKAMTPPEIVKQAPGENLFERQPDGSLSPVAGATNAKVGVQLTPDELKANNLPPETAAYWDGKGGYELKNKGYEAPTPQEQKDKARQAYLDALATAEAGDAVDQLTPEGKQFAANMMRAGFPLPLGFSPKLRSGIINLAGQDEAAAVAQGGPDAVARQSSIKADAQSLKNITTLEANIGSFEDTAKKNIQLMLDSAKDGGLAPTNVPVINGVIQPVRSATGLMDANKVAALNTYIATVRAEYAKVANGVTGGQAASDTKYNEIAKLFGQAQNLAQMTAAANAAVADMENRMSGFKDTKNRLLDEIGGLTPNGPSTPSAPKRAPGDADINLLKMNPTLAPMFDQKFGAGAARNVLKTQLPTQQLQVGP